MLISLAQLGSNLEFGMGATESDSWYGALVLRLHDMRPCAFIVL